MVSAAANLGLLGRLAPLDWAARLAGPILAKELRVASRRRRTYVLRFVYLAALTLFVAWAWASEVHWWTPQTAYDIQRMALIGMGITARIHLFQLIALPAIALVMLSTSITEEIRRRTLGVLMATPVSAFRIVLGKMAGVVLQLALLLAISLPLLVLIRVFGGVPWDVVAIGLATTLATCILVGSLSMLVSTFVRRPYVAVLVTMLLLVAACVGHYVGLVACAPAFTGGTAAPGGLALTVLIASLNPVFWAEMLWPDPRLLTAVAPIGGVWILWVSYCGAALAVSFLLLAWSARRLRRVALGLATADLRSRARGERLVRLPGRAGLRTVVIVRRVRGSPVFWRDKQVRFGPSRMAVVVMWSVLFSAAMTMDFCAFDLCGTQEGVAVALIGPASLLLWVVAVLVSLVQPASAFAGEQEAMTLPLLLVTPLSRGRIVFDKAMGALWRSLPVWVLLPVHLLLCIVFGMTHPIVLVQVGAVLAGTLVFVTGAGLYFSVRVRRPAVAMALNLCLAVLCFVGPPVAAEMSRYGPSTQMLASVCEWVDPARQVLMATQRAASGPRYGVSLSNLTYDLPCYEGIRRTAGWAPTTALLVGTSAVWAVGGLLFARGALRRLPGSIT